MAHPKKHLSGFVVVQEVLREIESHICTFVHPHPHHFSPTILRTTIVAVIINPKQSDWRTLSKKP